MDLLGHSEIVVDGQEDDHDEEDGADDDGRKGKPLGQVDVYLVDHVFADVQPLFVIEDHAVLGQLQGEVVVNFVEPANVKN